MGKQLNKDDLEKFSEITDVTFDHDGAHLAICHSIQGAANGYEHALITKAEDVDQELTKALEQITVTMSMEEYLRTFFDMYYFQAEFLTKMMGFETEDEYYERMRDEEAENGEGFRSYLDEKMDKIEILRSAKDTDFKDLSEEQSSAAMGLVTSFVKAIATDEKGFLEAVEKTKDQKEISSTADVGMKDVGSEEGSDSTVIKTSGDGDDFTKHKNGDSIATEDKLIEEKEVTKAKDTDVEKSQAELDLEKAEQKIKDLEKAAKDLADKEAKLEKATSRIEALEKAEEARIEKAYSGFADTLAFLGEEEDKAELVKALMQIKDQEAGVAVYKALEKAKAALTAAAEEEVGADGEGDVIKGNDVLSSLIDQKYGQA